MSKLNQERRLLNAALLSVFLLILSFSNVANGQNKNFGAPPIRPLRGPNNR